MNLSPWAWPQWRAIRGQLGRSSCASRRLVLGAAPRRCRYSPGLKPRLPDASVRIPPSRFGPRWRNRGDLRNRRRRNSPTVPPGDAASSRTQWSVVPYNPEPSRRSSRSEAPPADQCRSKAGQGFTQVEAALPTGGETLELMQMGDRLLHHPAQTAELDDVPDTAGQESASAHAAQAANREAAARSAPTARHQRSTVCSTAKRITNSRPASPA